MYSIVYVRVGPSLKRRGSLFSWFFAFFPTPVLCLSISNAGFGMFMLRERRESCQWFIEVRHGTMRLYLIFARMKSFLSVLNYLDFLFCALTVSDTTTNSPSILEVR